MPVDENLLPYPAGNESGYYRDGASVESASYNRVNSDTFPLLEEFSESSSLTLCKDKTPRRSISLLDAPAPFFGAEAFPEADIRKLHRWTTSFVARKVI